MRPKFQEDNNLLSAVRRGVLRREPTVDFQSAREAQLDGVPDPDVLRLCVAHGRILVTHDRNTIPGHARELQAAGHATPGVFVVDQGARLAGVIDELLLVWAASDAEEWVGRILWVR